MIQSKCFAYSTRLPFGEEGKVIMVQRDRHFARAFVHTVTPETFFFIHFLLCLNIFLILSLPLLSVVMFVFYVHWLCNYFRAKNLRWDTSMWLWLSRTSTFITGREAVVLFAWAFFRKCDSSAITTCIKIVSS